MPSRDYFQLRASWTAGASEEKKTGFCTRVGVENLEELMQCLVTTPNFLLSLLHCLLDVVVKRMNEEKSGFGAFYHELRVDDVGKSVSCLVIVTCFCLLFVHFVTART